MQSSFNFYSYYISCNWQWKLLLFALLIFPVLPLFGAVILALIIIKNFQLNFRKIKQESSTIFALIIIIWLVISSCFAYDKGEAFLGIANFLPGFIIFINFRLIVDQINQLKAISFALSFASTFMVILGL